MRAYTPVILNTLSQTTVLAKLEALMDSRVGVVIQSIGIWTWDTAKLNISPPTSRDACGCASQGMPTLPKASHLDHEHAKTLVLTAQDYRAFTVLDR